MADPLGRRAFLLSPYSGTAVASLRPLFSGVWRDASVPEYLFCVRPRAELPVKSRSWQRLVRGAVLARFP